MATWSNILDRHRRNDFAATIEIVLGALGVLQEELVYLGLLLLDMEVLFG